MSTYLDNLAEGARRRTLVLAARELYAEGKTWGCIADSLSVDQTTIFNWCKKVKGIALPTAEDLAPTTPTGRKRKYQAADSDKHALSGQYIVTNRQELAGSTEEAARMALRKGLLSPLFAGQVRDRMAAGLPLLPESIRKEILVPHVTIKQYRNPTDADLDYNCAPGSMMWIKEPITGQKRFVRTGDVLEMDDGTKNFGACVPWEVGGCPCSDKFGVKVARWQWLPAIDVASHYCLGYGHTARLKSSYRGADVTATLLGIFRQHGIWKQARFERGVFESDLVKTTLETVGVKLHTVWSPHQKAFVEGFFGVMWTKLSDLPGQVGRFQGEMEEQNNLIARCQRGTENPQNHFPLLSTTLMALDRSVAERNATRVKSRNYGSWIPEERFKEQLAERPLTPLDPASEWMFSPFIRTWTVQGARVGGSVNIAPGWSIRFDFGEAWLADFDGCKVKIFFDPSAPNCTATIVLAQNVRDCRAGKLLGVARQINEVARYARKVLGWGDDADMGLAHRRDTATRMRREVRTILPGGKSGAAISEIRDGKGTLAKVETSSPITIISSTPAPAPAQPQRAVEPQAPARNVSAPAPLPWSRRKLLAEDEATAT